MGYYEEIQKAKTRIRRIWIPKILTGEKITTEEIYYDLDKTGLIYSEKAIDKYIKRICDMEGFLNKNGTIEK